MHAASAQEEKLEDASRGIHHGCKKLTNDGALVEMIPDIGVREGDIRPGSNEIRLGLQRLLPAKNTNAVARAACYSRTVTAIGHDAAVLISKINLGKPDGRGWRFRARWAAGCECSPPLIGKRRMGIDTLAKAQGSQLQLVGNVDSWVIAEMPESK